MGTTKSRLSVEMRQADPDVGLRPCPSTARDSLNSSLLGKHSKQERFSKGTRRAI